MRDALELLGMICLATVFVAAVSGVTCNGTHYELSCTEKRGVEIRQTEARE